MTISQQTSVHSAIERREPATEYSCVTSQPPGASTSCTAVSDGVAVGDVAEQVGGEHAVDGQRAAPSRRRGWRRPRPGRAGSARRPARSCARATSSMPSEASTPDEVGVAARVGAEAVDDGRGRRAGPAAEVEQAQALPGRQPVDQLLRGGGAGARGSRG